MKSRGNPGLVGAGGIIIDDVAMTIISFQWHEYVNVDEMMALRIGLHEASHISCCCGRSIHFLSIALVANVLGG